MSEDRQWHEGFVVPASAERFSLEGILVGAAASSKRLRALRAHDDDDPPPASRNPEIMHRLDLDDVTDLVKYAIRKGFVKLE